MTTSVDLARVKFLMIQKLDRTLRENYHQSLAEILNELRVRCTVSQPDPCPDSVFSIILQADILSCNATPSSEKLRDAMTRLRHGDYGLCSRCGGEISAESLLIDPTALLCASCQLLAN